MKTVIVDSKETSISIKNSRLMVGTQGVPFRLIDLLVLATDVSLSSKTLLKLSKENIAVLMTSRNSADFALTLPQEARNSELKASQYRTLERRLELARHFVSGKIRSHAAHLEVFGVTSDKRRWLEKVASAETIADLMGYEGAFSRNYFSRFFEHLPKHFHKGSRSKRPALDPVNAILSYLYTIAYNVITARLFMRGFDPAISFLHTPFRSHYALSSDLMELFRAKINTLVMEWFLDERFEVEDFYKKEGVYLRYEKRKELWPEIKTFIDALSGAIDKEIATLKGMLS